jgi:hypothetical protein
MIHITIYLPFLLIFLFFFPNASLGQEKRTINPIATPAKLKVGGEAVKTPVPLAKETVQANVEKVFKTWNNGDMSNTLSDGFYNKSRFGDAMQTNVPTSSQLKIESMGSVQTMEQRIVNDPDGGRSRVTLGAVTVRSQVEFNDPSRGFVRVPGTNEIVFEMREKIK